MLPWKDIIFGLSPIFFCAASAVAAPSLAVMLLLLTVTHHNRYHHLHYWQWRRHKKNHHYALVITYNLTCSSRHQHQIKLLLFRRKSELHQSELHLCHTSGRHQNNHLYAFIIKYNWHWHQIKLLLLRRKSALVKLLKLRRRRWRSRVLLLLLLLQLPLLVLLLGMRLLLLQMQLQRNGAMLMTRLKLLTFWLSNRNELTSMESATNEWGFVEDCFPGGDECECKFLAGVFLLVFFFFLLLPTYSLRAAFASTSKGGLEIKYLGLYRRWLGPSMSTG